MDVRCSRCKTLFELADPEDGQFKHVKCGFCGHIFHPTKSDDAAPLRLSSSFESPYITHHNVETQDPQRKWLLRIAENGDILSFDDMTLLQQWIAQGRVGREDELSKSGKKWKALGSIDRLVPLFDAADGIKRFHAAISGTHSVLSRPTEPTSPDTEPAPEEPATPTPDWFDPSAPGKVSSYISANLPIPSELQPIAQPHTHNDGDATRNIDLDRVPIHLPSTQQPHPTPETDPVSPSQTKSFLYTAIVFAAILVCVCGYFVAKQTGAFSSKPTNVTQTPPTAHKDTTPKPETVNAEKDPVENPQTSAAIPSPPTKDTTPPEEHKDNEPTPDDNAAKPSETPDTSKKDPPPSTASSIDNLLKQAHTARQDGNIEEATALFLKVTQTHPKHPGGHTGLGWTYLSQNQNPRAVLAFRTALGTDPKYEDAMYGLAKALHQAKNLNKAAQAYERYLKIFPSGQHVIPARKSLGKLRGG